MNPRFLSHQPANTANGMYGVFSIGLGLIIIRGDLLSAPMFAQQVPSFALTQWHLPLAAWSSSLTMLSAGALVFLITRVGMQPFIAAMWSALDGWPFIANDARMGFSAPGVLKPAFPGQWRSSVPMPFASSVSP
jgi:hypothetical protein